MKLPDMGAAIGDLLVRRDLSVVEAADRHFAPGYRQCTDGRWSDRAEFVAHIEHPRAITRQITVEVHEELHDGRRYADRHTVTLTKNDDTRLVVAVIAVGETDEQGRLTRIEELTLLRNGSDADRDIGTAC
jgi:hypothetical protein